MKLLLLMLLFSFNLFAKDLVHIAVLDTGFPTDIAVLSKLKMCKLLYYTTETPDDEIGHATSILDIIGTKLKAANYCVYIFKVFSDSRDKFQGQSYIYDLEQLTQFPAVDIVNLSLGGERKDKLEITAIDKLLKKNIKIVAAAGNNAENLDDKNCNFYPACIPGVIVVGNLHNRTSNYGKRVCVWRDGNNFCIKEQCWSGSSQATAVYTSDLALELQNK